MRDAAAAAAVELGSTCLESGSIPVQLVLNPVQNRFKPKMTPFQLVLNHVQNRFKPETMPERTIRKYFFEMCQLYGSTIDINEKEREREKVCPCYSGERLKERERARVCSCW